MGKQRRLRVVGERQLIGRPLEAEPADGQAQRGVGAVKDGACLGKGLGEIPSHAGLLRALAGEQEDDVHARSAAPSTPK